MLDLNLLKLLSTLSPGGNTSVMGNIGQQDQSIQQPMIPGADEQNQLMQMLNPKDVQFNKFNDLIRQMPQRAQYPPSKTRQVLGAIANVGTGQPLGISGGQPIGYKSNIPEGLRVQSAIKDEPYNEAVKDWLRGAEPTLEAAKMENTRNVNSRIASSNVRTAQLREEGLNRQRNWDLIKQHDLEEKQKQGQEKIDNSKQRTAAYTYDKMHPNHVYKEDKDGNIFSLDPKTNAIEYLYDPEGNFVKSKNLPDEVKIKIQHENKLGEIAAGGSETRKTEATREVNREKLEGVQQSGRKELVKERAAVRGRTNAKAETPQAKQVRLFNKAYEGLNKNPDWAPYLQIDKLRKTFDIGVPAEKKSLIGKGTPAGDPKVAEAIRKYIYGDEQQSKTEIKPTTRADGKTHVKKKDTGETGWVTNPDVSKYELIP